MEYYMIGFLQPSSEELEYKEETSSQTERFLSSRDLVKRAKVDRLLALFDEGNVLFHSRHSSNLLTHLCLYSYLLVFLFTTF
jgi:hypothetical protein